MSLVAAYSFDDATTTTVNDDSGNGNTGSIPQPTHIAPTVNGHTNGGMLSDGANNAYVQVPRTAALEPAAALTIMTWVNAPDQSNYKTVLSKSQNSASDSYSLYVRTNVANATFALVTTSGETDIVSSTNIMDGTWHHMAATYDGTTVNFYLDGSLAGSATTSGSIVYDTTTDLTLGGSEAFPYESVIGSFDDVRIYDQALDQSAIQTLMNTPVTAANQTPFANAGSGQTVDAFATVTLDGSGSSDPDGTIAAYAWTQISGTSVTLSDATAEQPTFTAPGLDGGDSLVFGLVVTDNDGQQSSQSTVTITVNSASVFAVKSGAWAAGDIHTISSGAWV